MTPVLPRLFSGSNPGLDSPDTPPVQPTPVVLMLAHMEMPGGYTVTAVTRTWKDGDPARCRLCRKCVAVGDVCMVVVDHYVPAADAELLSVVDLHVQPARR